MRDTIDMAREAGAMFNLGEPEGVALIVLQNFEALVRADAIADEREAWAKVCDGLAKPDTIRDIAKNCADAIRARGNT